MLYSNGENVRLSL